MDDVVLFWNLILGYIEFWRVMGFQYCGAIAVPDAVDEYFVPIPIDHSSDDYQEQNRINAEFNVEKIRWIEVEYYWVGSFGSFRHYRAEIGRSRNANKLIYHRLEQEDRYDLG